jgi:hypothetical protein
MAGREQFLVRSAGSFHPRLATQLPTSDTAEVARSPRNVRFSPV